MNPPDPFLDTRYQLSLAMDRVLHAVPDAPPPAAKPVENPHLNPKAAAAIHAKGLTRLKQLRPQVEPILAAQGLPTNLVALMLVESAGNPMALSPKKARGLWQLMPGTARDYGLHVSRKRDERIQTEKSTLAAARLLSDLYQQFRDWPLAIAAYNAGKQAVLDAMNRAKGGDFWELSAKGLLPTETRTYVPAVLSLMQFLGPVN
jgi:membrane-bound lytic murein transglycosylase D